MYGYLGMKLSMMFKEAMHGFFIFEIFSISKVPWEGFFFIETKSFKFILEPRGDIPSGFVLLNEENVISIRSSWGLLSTV